MKLLRLLLLFALVSFLNLGAFGQITSYPFTESFQGITAGQPSGWGSAGTTTTATYHFYSYVTGYSGRGVRFDSYYNSSGKTSELTTPVLDLSALATAELKFHFKNPTAGNFEVLISTDGGTNYTSLQTGLTGQTAWLQKTYTITSYIGNNVKIKFKGTSNYGSGDAYIYLDEVIVQAIPTCIAPTNLGTSALAAITATITWDVEATATNGYNWEIVPSGDGQGNNVVTSGTVGVGVNSASVTGLTANTSYDLYVQSDCGGNGTNWSSAYTFYTGYCAASSSSTSSYIDGFTTTNGSTNISNTSSGYATGGYEDATAMAVSQYPGASINWATTVVGGSAGTNIWIDWNNDLVFDDATEKVYSYGSYGHGQTGTITVPGAQALGNYRMRIRFDYNSTNPNACGAGGGTRNETEDYTFTVTAVPSCLPPSAMAAGSITINSADLTWTASASSETDWNLEWKAGTDFTPGNSEEDGSTSISTTPAYSMSGLTSATQYYVYYQADCGGSGTGGWAGPFAFTTLISCPAPTGIALNTVTTTTADFTWTAGGAETTWAVEYGAVGFTMGTGTKTTVSAAAANLTGLITNTQYQIAVRAICGVGDTSSVVGGTFTTYPIAPATAQGVTCTTPGGASTILFTEDFETDPPSGWTGSFAGSNGQWDITGGSDNSAGTGPSASYAGSNHMEYEASSTTQPDEGSVVSPAIDLSAASDDAELSFWMHAYGANMGTLEVGVGTDAAGPFTTEFTWTGQYQRSEAAAWINVGVDLSAYVGQTIYIQFKQTDNSTDFTSDMSIDEMSVTACVVVATPPTCDAAMTSPANAATNIAVNSNITWSVATGFPSGYKLQIGTTMGGSEFLTQTDVMNVLTYNPANDFGFNTTYYVTITAYNNSGDATTCTEYSFTTRSGCVTATTPANAATGVSASSSASWSAITGVTGYKVSIGTTAGATDIVNAADNGTATTYNMSGASLAYNTTYYLTIVAYNNVGDATGCTSTSFTTAGNPNFGGGADGMDSNQPNSGGYYFANSLAAGNGLMTQPTYSWIDPVAAGHTHISSFTNGIDDGYSQQSIGFSFTFYGTAYTDAYVGTNGYVAFGSSYSSNPVSHSIPNNSDGSATRAMIHVASADLDGDNSEAKIYAGGDANHFVVTWFKYEDFNDQAEYITCQMILYPDGRIVMQYNADESTADEGTDLMNDFLVGIENAAGDKGIQYRNNGSGGPMFGSPMALAFNTSESALPVELTTFTATQEGTTNVLNWETASEQNNSHFEIERSTNGAEFENIGTIEGNGTTVATSKYNFVDVAPAMVSYYRLSQVDFDGNFEHSNIVIVKRNQITNNEVALYPVPVRDRLTVQYSTNTNEEIVITVNDVTGRTVVTKAVTATQGENQFFIDFSELPAGSYFVKLQSELNNTIRTVIKN
jgi:hypothetical protein